MEAKLTREQVAPVWFYSLAVLVTQMDNGAISTFLSSIMRQYSLSSADASWSSGLYTIGLVVGTPIVASLIELFGQRRVFLSELSLWFVGALITFVAPTYAIMLTGRLIQAVGDCGIIVMSIDAMIAVARHNHQGRKVSLMGIMSGLAALIAPILAGITLGVSGNWHQFYGLMLPVIFLLFLVGWKVLPEQSQIHKQKADIAGAITFNAGLTCWMLALTLAQHLRQHRLLVGVLLILGIICFWGFHRVEQHLDKQQMPFLPLDLLRKAAYRNVVLLGTIGGMFFALFIYIPTYASTTFNMSLQAAGMTLTAPGLGSIIGSILGGIIVDRFSNRASLVTASVMLTISTLGIAATITSLQTFLLLSFVMGVGMGTLMSAPLQVMAGRLAGHGTRAQAIGGLSAGKKVGLTIAPLLFATGMNLLMANGQLTIASFRSIFIIAAVLALVCLIISFNNADGRN